MSEFTIDRNIDGHPICRDGEPLTKEQIMVALNRAESLARSAYAKLDAFTAINNLCWKEMGKESKTLQITHVLDIAERYCD